MQEEGGKLNNFEEQSKKILASHVYMALVWDLYRTIYKCVNIV